MTYVACLNQDSKEIIEGNVCINSTRELYRVLLEEGSTKIIMKRDFAEEYFTPSGLAHFVDNAKSVKPGITFVLDDVLPMFNEDLIKEIRSFTSIDELIYAIERKPKEFMHILRVLCDNYINTYTEALLANNKIATLHLQNSSLLSQIESIEKERQNLTEVKNDYEAKFNTLLSRINFRYEKDVKGSTMFQVRGNRYDKILYIKEITRVHYTDTLIYYLQELLKSLYEVPVRLVVIEPPYAYGRAKYYPMCKPHFDLTYNDVRSENIFMAGMQAGLMENILKNSSSVNYLIILDRSGYAVPHVLGDNVEVVYCVSDTNDIDVGDKIPADRIISYSETTMNIPFIPGFNYLSVEEKINKYSSMTIIQKLIELIERR